LNRTSVTPDNHQARAAALAARLLDRAQLAPPHPGVTRAKQVAALAAVLDATVPSSPHGRLLALACIPTDRRPGGKTIEHRAVRYLLRLGERPTVAAVAAMVARLEREDRARPAPAPRPPRAPRGPRPTDSPAIAAQGPQAARVVAEHLAAKGAGPTWRELGRAMGWSYRQGQEAIYQLGRAGWLQFTRQPRSLRPGPLHQQGRRPA
jgi:hypothetical protein